MITRSRIFEVYEEEGKRRKSIFTKNLTPGKNVYGEKLVSQQTIEYREWNPAKSKLCSAMMMGCSDIKIRKGDVVLYLGSASGTTVSHVSDIVAEKGFVFALDFAPRVVRDLVFLSESRPNMAPILADANRPEKFQGRVSQVDIIYQDIAQKNQVEIFLKNISLFLKDSGFALLAIKSRSIDVTRKPSQIYRQVREELEKHLTIVDYRELGQFQKDHCFFICKKK